MNLLIRVLDAAYCRSTHHKLALDSLRHLMGPNTRAWKNMLLSNYKPFLDGAKAPDNTLRISKTTSFTFATIIGAVGRRGFEVVSSHRFGLS